MCEMKVLKAYKSKKHIQPVLKAYTARLIKCCKVNPIL